MYIYIYIYCIDECFPQGVVAGLRAGAPLLGDTAINPHLGLINAPLFLFFLQTTFFTVHLLSKWRHCYYMCEYEYGCYK